MRKINPSRAARGEPVNRIKGFVVLFIGLVMLMLGLGMWRSPEMNWQGFIQVWQITFSEIVRLFNNPFAILGILVFLVGSWLLFKGIRRLVRG